MKILLMGDDSRIEEFQEKNYQIPKQNITIAINKDFEFSEFDIIIDMTAAEKKSFHLLERYAELNQKVVILGGVQQSLAAVTKLMPKPIRCHLIGMNMLPTFINRNLWEMSALNETSKLAATKLLEQMGIYCRWVADRVGMVSARVVLMIINEAFYTLQEGTASKNDIDLAMKLGTSYPHGPFEWAELIGIQYVYETLEALYEDTHDERYRVCPLLKQTYFYALGTI
ncbi:MAG: 3-hydroxyacyl-CoA dehydrogenase family protein [Chitinophagales bacterium]